MMNNFNGYGWHNSHAYSVVNYNNTNHSDYTLAHEVGHNMGNAHDSANANVPGMYGYSYGYDDPWVFATIMGGNINTPRFGYFSNPNVTFPGVGSTGVHDSADNARSMRKTKETVSGFRPDTINRGSILDTSLITSGGVTQQLHFSDICGGGIPEISGVRLTFIEEIKPNTFTLEDIVHSTVSVSVYGNILSYTFNLDLTDVKVVSGSGNRQFDINFTPISPFLTGLVSVSLAIGPNIEDLNGNQLDLDLDGTYGETGDDRHIVSFGYDKGFDLPGVDCFGDRLTDAQLREIGKKIAEIMATIWDIDPGIETTDIITKDIIVIDNLAIDITTDFMDITTDFTTDTTINFQSSFLGY